MRPRDTLHTLKKDWVHVRPCINQRYLHRRIVAKNQDTTRVGVVAVDICRRSGEAMKRMATSWSLSFCTGCLYLSGKLFADMPLDVKSRVL